MSSAAPETPPEQDENKLRVWWDGYRKHFSWLVLWHSLITMAICLPLGALLAWRLNAKVHDALNTASLVLLSAKTLHSLARSFLPVRNDAISEDPAYYVESAAGWLSVTVAFTITCIMIG